MDRASVGLLRSTHEPHQRGLARPVTAKDAESLARIYAEVDVMEDGAHSPAHGVLLVDIFQFEHGRRDGFVLTADNTVKTGRFFWGWDFSRRKTSD
jgi:hypothetical protein